MLKDAKLRSRKIKVFETATGAESQADQMICACGNEGFRVYMPRELALAGDYAMTFECLNCAESYCRIGQAGESKHDV